MRPSMALLAALSGGPDPIAAQTLELEWTADPACPGEAEVQRLVAAMLAGSTSGELRASGLIFEKEGNFELDLTWQLGPWREHRILRSHDCDELARLAAMLLASTLDPFGAMPDAPVPQPAIVIPIDEPEPQPEPQPKIESKPPEPEPEPDESTWVIHAAEPETEPAPERRSDIHGLLLVDGLGVVGLLPRPGGGGRLGFGIEIARFRAIARGSAWFGPGFRSTTDPGVGGNLWAWSGELAACGVPRWKRLEFPLCGQLGAGQVVGTGVGVNDPRPSGQPWLWLGADASLEWWVVPRVALVAGLGLGGSLARPSFGVTGSDAQFTVPPVFGQIHAGLTARFGPRNSARRTKTARPDPDSQSDRP